MNKIILLLISIVNITTFIIYFKYFFDKKIRNFITDGKFHFIQKNERIKMFHFLLYLITNSVFIIILIRNTSLSTFSLFCLFIVNILFLVVSWWINIKFPLVNTETNVDELKETEKTNNIFLQNINVTNINNSNTINSSHTNNHFEETNNNVINIDNVDNSSTINNSQTNNHLEQNNNVTNIDTIDNSNTFNTSQTNNHLEQNNNVTNIECKPQTNYEKKNKNFKDLDDIKLEHLYKNLLKYEIINDNINFEYFQSKFLKEIMILNNLSLAEYKLFYDKLKSTFYIDVKHNEFCYLFNINNNSYKNTKDFKDYHLEKIEKIFENV